MHTPRERPRTPDLDALDALCAKAARRHGIPDYRDDLRQQAYLELAEVGYGDLHELVQRIAARERKRRQREKTRRHRLVATPDKRRGRSGKALELPSSPSPPPPKRVGIPTLCPRLAAVGAGTPLEDRLSATILAAATVVAPEILTPQQLGVFTMAYRRGWTTPAIARKLGTTERGVTERLKRISGKLQCDLGAALEVEVDDVSDACIPMRADPSPKSQRIATHSGIETCAQVMASLRRLSTGNPS